MFHITRSTTLRAAALAGALYAPAAIAQDMTNACPVDGCQVRIVAAQKDGDEITVTFEANFTPDMSKNHLHVWWGENYTVRQVSNNAETAHGVKQGDWHPTDEYPGYTTQSAVSVKERGDATSLCVSAADRAHDILDPEVFECISVAELVK